MGFGSSRSARDLSNRDDQRGARDRPGTLAPRDGRGAADAWVGPERVADLVVLIATGRADALSGRFLYALDDIEDLIRRADEIYREDLYTVRLRR